LLIMKSTKDRSNRISVIMLVLYLLFSVTLVVAAGREDEEPADENQKQDWDVMNPPGEFEVVAIDTDEGTWMDIDVSPSGDEIVFDLLGDIYTLPIAGGKANPLTEGVAWDMQPRYCPDGGQIAFTSDRIGGDNIWIMNNDGSGLRQLTKEDYRLLHSPIWTPDGRYVAGRKHFTSKRSLGAGEVWLYHVDGGGGVQMTKRPNDQKDLNEPAFSPCGRYLYFSQDVTSGDFFEYDKDSNKQIYIIKRLDRQTGEIERFITGPGGAIRPTPSPNGKYIAFIRRVRFKSTLFLHEIASGAEWPIYDSLDRDLQEAWAIHGVYPSMAWTPDSKSIVFWSGGKIRRINISTKEVSLIPFTVETIRKVYKALRYCVDVCPEEFKVKMLRWVTVSPNGGKVLFQALGYIYVRDLTTGVVARLTEQNEHFEFYPSWSRDDKWIVYVAWDDEKLGSVRIVSADGTVEKQVTSEPGHYIEPVFSPTGDKIVYRRIGADRLRSPTWQRNKGLYWISVEGGKEHLITKQASKPQFGADETRVYFYDVEGNSKPDSDKRMLKSIELDGSDERTHFVSKNATEYIISPDEKWLAFVERFNVYVIPFARSGREIEIGPKNKSLPIRKVSRDAGLYLRFSADSDKLYWSLGPELFEIELDSQFYSTGDEEELPVKEEGIDISFHAESDIPAGSVALVGASVITMKGDEVITNGTVLVEGNRIKAVGLHTEVQIPENALVLDISGKTIMPGLIDVHSHGPQGGQGLTPQQNWGHFADLAFGVTTNHDPSNDTELIFAAAELQQAGLITAPRIFSTGRILYGASGTARAEINSLEDALSHIRRMKAVGAFTVKSYNQPRRDQRQQVIEAGRQLGVMVLPEGGSLFHANMIMIVDGHTGIEHTIPLARAYNDVITLWSASGTGVTPTLVVGYGGLGGENYWYHHTNVWENKRLLTFVPRQVVDPRSRRRPMAPDEEYNHIDMARICKQLVDAGGHVQLGAHGQLSGLAAHWELWMFAQGGMTELQAIRAATLHGAWYIGMDEDLGSIEKGKLADLIVLEKNPLTDIRNSETVCYTMINGRLYDAHTMDQIGNHPAKRKKFYWETDYRLEK
jgi:imidazolonepropionase-like amidohydrolase/Tol biopolymer transport system component